MESIGITLPPGREVEFLELFGRWLSAPAGTTWSSVPPPSPQPLEGWDPTRKGEFEVGAALWNALSNDQRLLLDALAVVQKIEAAQLAVALGLSGPLAVAQQAAAVNAAAVQNRRLPVVRLSVEAGSVVAVLDDAARNVLLQGAEGS